MKIYLLALDPFQQHSLYLFWLGVDWVQPLDVSTFKVPRYLAQKYKGACQICLGWMGARQWEWVYQYFHYSVLKLTLWFPSLKYMAIYIAKEHIAQMVEFKICILNATTCIRKHVWKFYKSAIKTYKFITLIIKIRNALKANMI